MTVAWYTAGGLAAGAAMKLLSAGANDRPRRRRRRRVSHSVRTVKR
jgi:hypothetical protein